MMFTTAQYQIMQKECPKELKDLLSIAKLDLPIDSNNAFGSYSDIDKKLEHVIAQQLKRNSLQEGCYHLLSLAGISYGYDETTKDIVAKVLENKDRIRKSATTSKQ